jgi:hypothetical protein
MRTSTLADAPSGRTPPVRVRRHHPSRIVVATGALTLLAITAGAGIALVDRPALTPGTPTAPAVARTPAGTTAQPVTPATAGQGGSARPALALADGSYPAFIRKIDTAHRTMVVDVIQVFEGKAAFQAGIEDGLGQDAAGARDPYIRNRNPLLRTLPVAQDASIQFRSACEGPTAARAVLGVLAKHATASEFFYYTLTISHGSVLRIVEHQAQPAC